MRFCLKSDIIFRLLKTVFLYYNAFVTIGYYYTITSITLYHLRILSKTSSSEIGLLFTARGIGLIPSSILAGYYYRAYRRESSMKTMCCRLSHNKILLGCLFIIGLTMISVPWISSLWILCMLHFYVGLASSLLEIGCYLQLCLLWVDYPRILFPVQSGVQFTYGIGSICFSFLDAQIFKYVEDMELQLHLSYYICAALTLLPIPFLWLCPTVVSTSRKIRNIKEVENDEAQKEGEGKDISTPIDETKEENIDIISKQKSKLLIFGVGRVGTKIFKIDNLVLLLTAILLCFSAGLAVAFGNLLFLYGKRRNLGSDSDLAYLTSIFYAFFSFTRLILVPIGLFVSPMVILVLSLVGSTWTFLLFLIFQQSDLFVWICTILYGIFGAPLSVSLLMLPSTAFGIPMNSYATSFLMLGQFVGEGAMPTLLSLLCDERVFGNEGFPMILFVLSLGSTILYCVVVLGMKLLCYRNWKKKESEKVVEEKKETNQKQDVKFENDRMIWTGYHLLKFRL